MAAPPPSALDANQVLQHSFEDSTGEIRVKATFNPGGGTEVEIDHTNDSIRLGDGTSFLTSTTVSGDIGLDVNIINTSLPITILGIDTPTVSNISVPVANTEQSFVFPITTKKAKIRLRGNGKLKYSFIVSTSGTNYITVFPGAEESFENLDLSGGLTMYFQSTKGSEILEILYWA